MLKIDLNLLEESEMQFLVSFKKSANPSQTGRLLVDSTRRHGADLSFKTFESFKTMDIYMKLCKF
jgi:hypothetical protein